MPKRKKSNLSKKSKKSRILKDFNTSQSAEDYTKKLEAQRISNKKFSQNQSSEQKAKKLEEQRHCNLINNRRMFNVGTDHLAIKPYIQHKSLPQ